MTKKELLKKLIEISGSKTQREFAKITNTPFQKINSWIVGRENFTDLKIKYIADKLGYIVNVKYEILKKK